eukprot:131731_1
MGKHTRSLTSGTEPEQCGTQCTGVCITYFRDLCGNCLTKLDPTWNSCVGCDGLPDNSTYDCAGVCAGNSTYDCTGVCGGDFAMNPCSHCINSTRTDFTSFGKDCTGNCINDASKTHQKDKCGQCLLISDSNWNRCVGCDGIPDSGFEFNVCGQCLHSNDTVFETAGKDCYGTCNGNHTYDQCGACLATNDESMNVCLGCDGVPFSNNKLNPCGYCINSATDDFNAYGCSIHSNSLSISQLELYDYISISIITFLFVMLIVSGLVHDKLKKNNTF